MKRSINVASNSKVDLSGCGCLIILILLLVTMGLASTEVVDGLIKVIEALRK